MLQQGGTRVPILDCRAVTYSLPLGRTISSPLLYKICFLKSLSQALSLPSFLSLYKAIEYAPFKKKKKKKNCAPKP